MTNRQASFKAFRQFNDPTIRGIASLRGRLDENLARLFQTDAVLDRLALELARRRVLPLRELVESAEFFERVRKSMRGPIVADMCCGHGLLGILFALLERRTERVLLVDRRRPPSFSAVLDAAAAVGPWVVDKVRYLEMRVQRRPLELGGESEGASIVAVHACGARTDRCLEQAVARGAPVAVMPCCYRHTADRVPEALRESLGVPLATDVDRTYRLDAAGYRVMWTHVPPVITAHNRVLIALPPPSAPPGLPSHSAPPGQGNAHGPNVTSTSDSSGNENVAGSG
jgi:hypothetical protein